jgi:hypothetical protein
MSTSTYYPQLTPAQRDAEWAAFVEEQWEYLTAPPLRQVQMRIEDWETLEDVRLRRRRPATYDERWDGVLRRAESRIYHDDWLSDDEKIEGISQLLDMEVRVINRHIGQPTYRTDVMLEDLRRETKYRIRRLCGDRRYSS